MCPFGIKYSFPLSPAATILFSLPHWQADSVRLLQLFHSSTPSTAASSFSFSAPSIFCLLPNISFLHRSLNFSVSYFLSLSLSGWFGLIPPITLESATALCCHDSRGNVDARDHRGVYLTFCLHLWHEIVHIQSSDVWRFTVGSAS